MIHVCLNFRHCRLAIYRAGHQCCIQPQLFLHHLANVFIKILCRIRKSGKDENLLIARIDRRRNLLTNDAIQLVQFEVVFRRDILHHGNQVRKTF